MDEKTLEQLNKIKTEYTAKKIIQDQEKGKKGKYAHIKKNIDDNGVEYEVNEHLFPDGDIAFDIVFYKEIDKITYIKSICYGGFASERSFDWCELIKEE